MRVDIRPVSRLRGSEPVDAAAVLGPVIRAACEGAADPARVRLACDWIQYRHNFRGVLDDRPVLAPPAPVPDGGPDTAEPAEAALELALDLRRCPGEDLATLAKEALAGRARPGGDGRVPLEPWCAGRDSLIWRFNALYWQELAAWEQATGAEYERALPGGRSDARDDRAVTELIGDLFATWDALDDRGELPEELFVVELGVGNGNQARAWLDAFARLDHEHGRGYYRRLHYLMGDYSAHVLERARRAVAGHAEHVSSLVLDATRPAVSLGFLRRKVFCVYISNVYDNLPTDEVARIDGRTYRVEARAYLPAADAERIARTLDVPAAALPGLVDKLLRLGPGLLADAAPYAFAAADAGIAFWRDAWSALRLRERYVRLEDPDAYVIAPGLTGAELAPLLDAEGDVRMHVSNGAAGSFAETLPLLHPHGRLHCHDLFVTETAAYRTGFRGPGKYDGSVVNWINGPLLWRIGDARGVDVAFLPFAARPGAAIKTLTARPRP